MYVPSSRKKSGNPIGFQRWVNVDNAKGITKRKIDRWGIFLL
jgi:hypothetical protein